MSMDGKVVAYSTRTGREARVPPHYLTNPVLAAQWSPTPVVGTTDRRPSTSWNNPDIETWADEHGVDLGEAETKAEMLAVISNTPDPADTPSPDNTPA